MLHLIIMSLTVPTGTIALAITQLEKEEKEWLTEISTNHIDLSTISAETAFVLTD